MAIMNEKVMMTTSFFLLCGALVVVLKLGDHDCTVEIGHVSVVMAGG